MKRNDKRNSNAFRWFISSSLGTSVNTATRMRRDEVSVSKRVAGMTLFHGHAPSGPHQGLCDTVLRDLDTVVELTPSSLWRRLEGRRIFLTGGTGFFGRWLLGSLVRANARHGLGVEAHVLTRNLDAFRRKEPWLASQEAVCFHEGTMVNFRFPPGRFDFIIHAASESNSVPDGSNPVPMLDSNVLGTRRVLEFARSSGTGDFLYTSSGAVYGDRYAPPMEHVEESYGGAPDPSLSASAYGIGKRMAEFLCRAYADQYEIRPKIARCFAFVGPYLPMTANYAIGNFIHNALHGRPLRIVGDGTPHRSYLYAADLAIWLWTILLEGKPCYPYNVGSEEIITISDLAKEVVNVINPGLDIEIARSKVPGARIEYYVPSTQRARLELSLEQSFSLHDSIKHTAIWYEKWQRQQLT